MLALVAQTIAIIGTMSAIPDVLAIARALLAGAAAAGGVR